MLLVLFGIYTGNQENKNAIRVSGAIPHIINLLSSGDTEVQYAAGGALWNLASNNQENQSTFLLVVLLRLL